MDTLREKLGIGGPRPQKMNDQENGTTLNKDEQEAMLSENQDLKSEIHELKKKA